MRVHECAVIHKPRVQFVSPPYICLFEQECGTIGRLWNGCAIRQVEPLSPCKHVMLTRYLQMCLPALPAGYAGRWSPDLVKAFRN